jgi:probable HAF family extracellular repeat protein
MIASSCFRPAMSHLVLALALLAMAGSPARGQVLYTIRDLGVPYDFTQPMGINNAGQVVATAIPPGGSLPHAFRIPAGGTFASSGADLGTLPGGENSQAGGINALGQVTGASFVGDGNHAIRTTATGDLSSGTDLGFLPGTSGSFGRGINSAGQVVGNSIIVGGSSQAFRTTPTGLVSDPGANLGSFGGAFTIAYGINDSGQVTGSSPLPGGSALGHAFRTSPTGTLSDPGADLGSLPGYSYSTGSAINVLGQVTGYSGPGNGEVHAFRTTPTGLISDPGTALGSLPGFTNSKGNGINALGVVVGTSYNADVSAGHAFIYDTQMRDLNDLILPGSGWVLTSGSGINDLGLITGYGQLNGQSHAFVLTPVPEPSALALAGLAAFSWVVRRKWARRAPAQV